jgi:hypothetical protein
VPEGAEAVIRRRPTTRAQRCRRALSALTVAAVTIVAVRALDPPGGSGPAGAAGAAGAAGTPAHGRLTRSPPKVAITRVFRAAGGAVTAVVTEKGAPACEVDLLGPTGSILARGWAGGRPVTLRAVAVANTHLSLVLRPTGGTRLSWQAELSGAGG